MPEFIYVLRPTRPAMLTEGLTEQESQAVSDHYDNLMRLGEQGVMILFGRTATTGPETFGIVVFESESEESARRLMESDPAIVHGVMSAELFPYRVAYVK